MTSSTTTDTAVIPNIDTAISAWKSAKNEADRALAAEAIEQHIAAETPEGGDYEYATSELIERLKKEFGPVPVEDLRDLVPTATRFFIAVPADPQRLGLYGIGTSEEGAIADAYEQTNREPTPKPELDYSEFHGMRMWFVGTHTFHSEEDAEEFVERRGFRALECTERLYREVERNGADERFSWAPNTAGLQDLIDEDAEVDA